MNRFLPSTFRNANQDVPSRRSLQILQAAILAKWNSTEASVQKNVSATDNEGFKGHGMVAPFTAGWQTMDLNPLVIDKSEGSYVYDRNGNKYLDSLAGL